MSDIGGAGSPFDLPFLVLQALGAVLYLVAIFAVRAPVTALRALQPTLCVGLPVLWMAAWPVQSGIDGAARFLFGAPASVLAGALGLTWVVISARRSGQGVWRVAWPAVAALGLSAAGWCVFLFS